MRSTTKRPDRRPPLLAAAMIAAAGLAAIVPRLMASDADLPAPPPAAPAPLPPPAPPATAAPAAPAPTADGLRLFGLLGRGAVIGSQGGQAFYPVGREIRPGLRVARIEQHHVALATEAGEIRLGFDGAQAATAPSAGPSTATPARAAATGSDSLDYRFGLVARREGGRITGFAVREGANLPLLQQAGLQPGDVIIAVNGQHFDSDEKVMELPSEISGAFTAEFEFERNGRRVRAYLPVNPRGQDMTGS